MRKARLVHLVLAAAALVGFTLLLAFLLNLEIEVAVVGVSFVLVAGGIGLLGFWLLRRESAPVVAYPGARGTAFDLMATFLYALLLILGALGLFGVALSLDRLPLIVPAVFLLLSIGIDAYLAARLVSLWARRRATERVVFGQLATIVRQNLPLATGVSLAAQSERGAARVHLYRIGHLLAQGVPLSDAIRLGYPNCPALPLTLVLAGERSGRLSVALDQAEEHLVEMSNRREQMDVPVWPYLAIYCTTLAFVVTGLMVAIVPKFKEIFKDFEAKLPPSTILLVEISELVGEWGAPLLLLLLLFPLSVYWSLRPRRVPRPTWASCAADWIRWHAPGISREQFGSGLAAVLRVVRFALGAGMRLDSAFRLASDLDVNVNLRPRVRRLADLLEGGADARDAVRTAGLGNVTAIAMASGERSGNMDAALRYAADYHDAIASRWWTVVRNLSWPLATLTMGCLVGFVAFSMFHPLVSLIDATAATWGH